MENEPTADAAARTTHRSLRLVHSRPGMAAVPRLSARAQGWAKRGPRAAETAPRRPNVDASIYSQALGDLIIAAGGRVPERVVIASATRGLDASAFTCELAIHARRIGLAVLAAEITSTTGRTALQWFDAPGIDSADPDPLALDLFNPRWPEDFASWRSRTARFADMVLIAGPSLDRSIDAALVASEFDGIILLAHRNTTPRPAIEDAARRCRGLGAKLYGAVMLDGGGSSFLRQAAQGSRPIQIQPPQA